MSRGPRYDLDKDPNKPTSDRWLVHFRYTGPFKMIWPHWVLNYHDDGVVTIRCAVVAPDLATARQVVIMAHERRPNERNIDVWGACQRKAKDWSPFEGRFEREVWMEWPT